MSSSALMAAATPPSASSSSLSTSTFLNPISLRTSPRWSQHRRLLRVSVPRNSSSTTAASSSDHQQPTKPPQTSTTSTSSIFGGQKELKGIQVLVDKLSPPVRLAASAVVVAGALSAGYGLGFKFGGSRNAAIGGAVALGTVSGAAAYAVNACASEVAAVSLHNYVAGFDDPTTVKKEEIERIASKYGVSKRDETFNAELCYIYSEFVSSVLPPGGQDLKGDEVDRIKTFKNALAIDDPDAAAMHIEVGRKIFRQRLEAGDRDENIEERRAFQKLIYVSNLVFEDAAAFLLPWKRIFKVTDSQVELAVRDNAQRLYASALKSVSTGIDAEQLIKLREAQLMYGVSDETAETLFRERTRGLVEENVLAALSIQKSRTRLAKGVGKVVEQLDKIIEFNNRLILLKSHAGDNRFAPGIGPVSLVGGDFDDSRKTDDLKLLYKTYITESLSEGRMEDSKLAALNQLRNIFGLRKHDAEAITFDIVSKVYRKRLAQAVTSGNLEIADSKAAFLQNLCDELHFDPQKASQIHEEIYRQKLHLCVGDGELSDEDVTALLKLRVMLCIPQQTVEAVHSDICGSIFEKVVTNAIASGVEGFKPDLREDVKKAAHGLRLTKELVISITTKAVKRIFKIFVARAQGADTRQEAAKALGDLIAFNNLVVTKLLEDIKGESSEEPSEDVAKEEVHETEIDKQWGSLQTLNKVSLDEECMAILRKRRTGITLKDDLEKRDRIDLYKTYLLSCLKDKETRKLGVGLQFRTKVDNFDYIPLNQLGEIFCLTSEDIVGVHRNLAEETFAQKAEVILADGLLTKARAEQLNDLQKEVGLPPEYAQKIIKSISSSKMSVAIQMSVNQGRLSIKQVRELKEAGVEIENMISKSMRELIFKKTLDDIFSSGTGEFDEEEVYEKIPVYLSIDTGKARDAVHELAKSRLSNSLIQAIALLRRRDRQGVVSSLNDLLACDKALPSEPLSWEVPDELADLYAIYMKSDPAPERLSRMQYLLGISDATAEALEEAGDQFLPIPAEEKFVF